MEKKTFDNITHGIVANLALQLFPDTKNEGDAQEFTKEQLAEARTLVGMVIRRSAEQIVATLVPVLAVRIGDNPAPAVAAPVAAPAEVAPKADAETADADAEATTAS